MKTLQYCEISSLLKIKQPLLMIDLAQVDVENKTASATKCISMNEITFEGHFPNEPILPGVLHVTGAMQTCSLLLKELIPQPEDHTIILRKISRYKFRNPAVPGDLIKFEITTNDLTEDGIAATAKVYCGETVISEGRIEIGYIPKSEFHKNTSLPTDDCPKEFELNTKTIMRHIPHRFPFLFVDRVISVCHEQNQILAYKNVTGNDYFMQALDECFAMPSALLAEAAAQASCCYALSMPSMAGKIGLFFSIDNAEFYKPVVPGDRVYFKLYAKPGRISFSGGEFIVNNEVIGKVEMKFVLVSSI